MKFNAEWLPKTYTYSTLYCIRFIGGKLVAVFVWDQCTCVPCPVHLSSPFTCGVFHNSVFVSRSLDREFNSISMRVPFVASDFPSLFVLLRSRN